ncbi:OmpA/MotB family protein [Anaerosacchariphilus polymeriproducens]|uniref:Chemotaxis protein n=1 Tax=Anaerosacchariphilus polymeriproducens TaxID=1812858 RepID=A0A371AS87_9FIRM|nr:flagellar motor protein MotB [Anaerosacchariphilus polymeriproducens]RDU22426.1 chemotaxis protein [Anaerosacchariphilus polymeriproducens]
MAKKRKEETGPKGAPAWMTTFGDLMNLLLCFFVLLFSMSSVDAEKFENMIASLNSSFSILSEGGTGVGEGTLISAGVSQLAMFEEEYSKMLEPIDSEDSSMPKDFKEEYQSEALKESEKMAENIEKMAQENEVLDKVQIDFTSQYALLTLNGALLFESGSADIVENSYPLVDKIGTILEYYNENIIEIEGHTDNVPIHGGAFKNNEDLSCQRALAVAEYFRNHNSIDPVKLKYSGRGEYAPIADNTTVEGRAQNRRVEIKIYNSFSDY